MPDRGRGPLDADFHICQRIGRDLILEGVQPGDRLKPLFAQMGSRRQKGLHRQHLVCGETARLSTQHRRSLLDSRGIMQAALVVFQVKDHTVKARRCRLFEKRVEGRGVGEKGGVDHDGAQGFRCPVPGQGGFGLGCLRRGGGGSGGSGSVALRFCCR